MASEGRYRFVCSSCGEAITVDESMKQTLLETGCIVCGATPTEEEFTTGSATDR